MKSLWVVSARERAFSKKKTRFSSSGFFFIVILVMASLLGSRNLGSADEIFSGQQDKEIVVIPLFTCRTIDGKILNSETIGGKKSYFQFISAKSLDQIDLLRNVYRDFLCRNDFFNIIFVDDTDRFFRNLSVSINSLNLVTENYEQYRLLFSVPSCCEKFFIFDQDRRLVYSGTDIAGYKEEVKPQLLELIKQPRAFHISMFAEEGKSISSSPWLSRLRSYMKASDFKHYIFSFHTNICSSCMSGAIINKMNFLQNINPDIFFASILPANYEEADIINLKQHLQVRYEIFRADGEIEKRWNELADEFGASKVTDIIVLIGNEGRVIRSVCANPLSVRDFFENLKKYLTAPK